MKVIKSHLTVHLKWLILYNVNSISTIKKWIRKKMYIRIAAAGELRICLTDASSLKLESSME